MAEDSELLVWHQIEWKISNFFDLPIEVDYCLHSPTYPLSDATWFIKIYPNGETINNSDGFVSLYLHKEISTKERRVGIRIGIKKENGAEIKAFKGEAIFEKRKCGWGTYKFVERASLSSSKDTLAQNAGGWWWSSLFESSNQPDTVVPDVTLIIFCSVRIAEECSSTDAAIQTSPSAPTTLEATSQTPSSDGIFNLCESLKDVYLSRRYSDVTITVKDKKYFAHRNIVSASSPALASMLQHEMAEKKSRTVDIDDCDPETFGDFLLFLHTGNVDMVTPSSAVSLFEIADKFDVKILKKECVRQMVRDKSESTEDACAIPSVSEKVYFPFAY